MNVLEGQINAIFFDCANFEDKKVLLMKKFKEDTQITEYFSPVLKIM